MDQAELQSGHRVLVWGAAGGLGVFALQLAKLAGAEAVGVVSSAEKGELCSKLGACAFIDRNEFAGMMRRGGETPEEEKARFKESRRFCKHVAELLGGQPDIVFEHVGKATFPTSVLAVKPFGKVVICGATSGYHARLRRPLPVDAPEADHRLALRQRLGVQQGQRADRAGQDPPRAVEDAAVRRRRGGAPADARQQAPRQDRDPRRAPRPRARARPPRARARSERRWVPDGRAWFNDPLVRDGLPRRPVRGGAAGDRAGRAALRGDRVLGVYRTLDDRYRFQQFALFEDQHDFELYWNGPEFVAWRADYSSWYPVPVVYAPMKLVAAGASARTANGNGAPGVSPARAEPSSAPRR